MKFLSPLRLVARKLLLMVSCLLMLCGLTGCVRFRANITIRENGKADLSMMYAISDTLTELSGGTVTPEEAEIEAYRAEGWQYEEYASDGYSGYQLSRSDISVQELASSMASADNPLAEAADQISFRKEGGRYILDIKPFSSEDSSAFTEYKQYFSMLNGYCDLTVTLPQAPKSHNATSVSADGKTLTWDLLSMKPDETIHLEFTLPFNKLLLLIPALLILLLLLLLILKGRNRRKKAAAAAQASPSAAETEVSEAQPDSSASQESVPDQASSSGPADS